MQTLVKKLQILTRHTYIWHPHWGSPHQHFAEVFGTRKVVPGLLYGDIYMILHLVFNITPACDRQIIDEHTQNHSIYRSAQHRAVKIEVSRDKCNDVLP